MAVPDKSIDPRLLASAQAEFMKHGYLKAELKTICDNADITTGAVYKRYKGKEDLFSAVVEDIADELNHFVESRSDLDFSALSDDEIYNSWVMTYSIQFKGASINLRFNVITPFWETQDPHWVFMLRILKVGRLMPYFSTNGNCLSNIS